MSFEKHLQLIRASSRLKTGMSDWWLGDYETSDSRIVISSASEKSFLQTGKRCMCERRNTQHQGVVSVSVPM